MDFLRPCSLFYLSACFASIKVSERIFMKYGISRSTLAVGLRIIFGLYWPSLSLNLRETQVIHLSFSLKLVFEQKAAHCTKYSFGLQKIY
jgi:hypothetical protein